MPYFTNDAVVFGWLLLCLTTVFVTSSNKHPFWRRFYCVFPPLLVCYFLPALLHWPLGLVSKEHSQLYFVASRYLLPAGLVLLCLSVNFRGLVRLGPKAVIMFLTATVGIIVGGPIALLLVSSIAPDWLGANSTDVWRGLSTVAGSWIGGGANQTAMKEIYEVGDSLFATMIIIDVVVANMWMAFLLMGANHQARIDRWLKADSSAIEELKTKAAAYQARVSRIPETKDLLIVLTVAFVATGLAHWGGGNLAAWFEANTDGSNSFQSSFFWLIVIATTLGLALSFTPMRSLEGVGASKVASVFIYILVATIGMKMNLGEVANNLGLFAVGLVWMLVHVVLLIVLAKLTRSPFFFVAVGSQANVGGAASAPVVASAFHPALAPVGGIMAVWGYVLGTYGALFCAYLMRIVTAQP